METIWRQLTYQDIRNMASDHAVYRAVLIDQLNYRGLYLVWRVIIPAEPAAPTFADMSADHLPLPSFGKQELWHFVEVKEMSPDTSKIRLDDNYRRIQGRNPTDFRDGWPALSAVYWIEHRPSGAWDSAFDVILTITEAAQVLAEGKV